MNTDLRGENQREGSFATLRRFVPARPAGQPCELCSATLTPEHQHLVEPAHRPLICCCDACAILFSGAGETKYRRVPRRIQRLPDFQMTDPQWDSLMIPINVAFFFKNSAAGRVMALYPSPAGATESLLELEAWQELAAENPVLNELEQDVEALLVNRLGDVRDHYRVPIDECYALVGLIRANWRGLSGGNEVWAAIAQFFTRLQERSSLPGAQIYA